jgi:hypothetical protein
MGQYFCQYQQQTSRQYSNKYPKRVSIIKRADASGASVELIVRQGVAAATGRRQGAKMGASRTG